MKSQVVRLKQKRIFKASLQGNPVNQPTNSRLVNESTSGWRPSKTIPDWSWSPKLDRDLQEEPLIDRSPHLVEDLQGHH